MMYTCTVVFLCSIVKKMSYSGNTMNDDKQDTIHVTRDLVARKAKVSSATVSRVFNCPSAVSEPMRQAVLDAARDLGYRPNKAAGALRRNGTGTIALVEFVKPPRRYYWGALKCFDWFFASAMRGVQQALAYSTWHFSVETAHDEKELLEISRRCDGIVSYDVDTLQEAEMLDSMPVPYVLAHHIGTSPEFQSYLYVGTDNRFGGKMQGRWLVEQGCRRPVYVTGWRDFVDSHAQRYKGFMESIIESGANPLVLDIEVGSVGAVPSVLKRIADLCRSGEVDSIAAVNDMTLYEILFGLRAAGIQTPSRELPAAGYDATPYYRFLPGPLASIDIDPQQVYCEATKLLVRKLSGERVSSLICPPKLQVQSETSIVFV